MTRFTRATRGIRHELSVFVDPVAPVKYSMLTLENTSTTSPMVVWYGSNGTTPVTNGTLKNCVVRNGANTNSAVVISDGATAGNAGYFSNIDVRNNKGGNIDSWILGRLLRKAWFYWSQHSGRQPLWNMQFAFRGHVAVICNEWTASDGEAFSEGIKRLKIGKVIGTRTWGGEIWLSMKNLLVDRGLASAAEFGVFGPEGAWLIEGHGVEPDIVVDNLPHATFQGDDAQLRAAVDYLQQKIAAEPVTLPEVPKHPDKSWKPPVR